MATVIMKAPAGMAASTTINLIDGTSTQVDAFGYVTVNSIYVNSLEVAGFIAVLNPTDTMPNFVYNKMTNTTAAVIAASQMAAVESVFDMAGTLGAGATLTLPTVAALAATMPEWVVGMTTKIRVINSGAGAFAWTLTTNTTWTMTGTMTVAQNTWRDFLVTFQSGVAGTITAVGTGTNS